MKKIIMIAVYLALNFTYARLAVAAEQQAESTAATEGSAASGDELHFVSVLTLQGEIVAVDPSKRLIKVKGPAGEIIELEAKSGEALAERKVGERVLVRYFEGAQIAKGTQGEAVPVQSLKDGLIEPGESSEKQRALAASVERVDADNQEITLKGTDGTIETIMVSNPTHLRNIDVGDRVFVTHPQGLALSIEREG